MFRPSSRRRASRSASRTAGVAVALLLLPAVAGGPASAREAGSAPGLEVDHVAHDAGLLRAGELPERRTFPVFEHAPYVTGPGAG